MTARVVAVIMRGKTRSRHIYANNGLSHSSIGSFRLTRWPFSKSAT
jgi:hypothetical protein